MGSLEGKLCLAMVGLPAMGKSTVALRIAETLEAEGVGVRIFNNGDVRRRMLRGQDTAGPGFYDPANSQACAQRENIAKASIGEAREFLAARGEVAILDATNLTRARRRLILDNFADTRVLFVSCVNDDPELMHASILRKTKLPEFSHLTEREAYDAFCERIGYYRSIAQPLADEPAYLIVDTLNNRILGEHVDRHPPHYGVIRDLLVSDWVKNLYVARHGESYDNIEGRIGGDSRLTPKGLAQAGTLAAHFRGITLSYVFTSRLTRSRQTAEALVKGRERTTLMALAEFDEIDAGDFEGLSFDELRRFHPEQYEARNRDKYAYVYPGGEGYAALRERVSRGIKKALYLSGNSPSIMIVGHQAVNRMILSHFLFRREEDLPYALIPQNRYFHLVSTPRMRLVELKSY
ncbi:MAG: histidine phosphatase family protein [Desulfovibrionaceae bacterium]|nr:histidine phosphatase family protein [Desulfovibrionaceae bacterium]MBF0514742.1 histidine phosphatase family protein [Desulfovibrionaceae bacterium]